MKFRLSGDIGGYLGGWYCLKREEERCVYCGGVNWPPNHPGGVALIKRKNKRLVCEPMRMHWRNSQAGQTGF